ncbi:hypothetical protein GJ744_010567 [Endocarpon pusillum]|uniref:NB-ARC domain-containing protein n=1 Tax=Endocarpon pusillum TaxID=364733 RepID=A0A8H7AUC1_9EURO|nr:hypothetical protein GJ744_010567 [Endocarpon pusillum]
MASRILKPDLLPQMSGVQEEGQLVNQLLQWMSRPANIRWLLIFDNYDNPQMPGQENSNTYDIRQYFPHAAQGSIIISTRSPRLTFGKTHRLEKLDVQQLDGLQQSLSILAHRSGWSDVAHDPDAEKLVKRLDGLPLALTTAGAYLSQTPDSFAEYIQTYENSWADLEETAEDLLDYPGRTLYNTWMVSFKLLQAQDKIVARLLQLLAYFDNQDILVRASEQRHR